MNEPCSFLSISRGDYFCHCISDFSAYQGWFVFFENQWDLFKILDSVGGDVSAKLSHKTLHLTNSGSKDVTLDLDFRWIHDFDDKGRIYEVYEKNNLLVVKYTKFSDDSLSNLVFSRYLVFKGLSSFNLIKSWQKKSYPYDAERKSLSELYVFRLLEGTFDDLFLGFGVTEEEAFVNAQVLPVEENNNKLIFNNYQKILNFEDKDVLNSVSRAFSSCVKINKLGDPLIFAGYPWFYQVWGRDECISVAGLFAQKDFITAKKIIIRNLKSITSEGVLQNRYPESSLASADAAGWLFQRIYLFFKLSKDLGFSRNELVLMESKLDAFLAHCKNNSYKGLVYNGPKETWMDTTDPNFVDTREGARVEVQALYLSALELKLLLRKIAGDHDQTSNFKHLIAKKKTLIRSQLIKEGILRDGLNKGVVDLTSRPNVFLAYYAYPSLVMDSCWSETFNKVLSECWLEWGGLASISKDHYLFKDTYSGMDNESYHRGDSWFFVNNITGIVLHDFDQKEYSIKINTIKNASLQEFFNSGFAGYCAEVSSAKELSSKGCLNQAWSSATLLEFLRKTN